MVSADNQPQPRAADADEERSPRIAETDRASAARALAAIDTTVFPEATRIPFHEQSVLIRRAVMRLFGHG